jgi:hypothetical protein
MHLGKPFRSFALASLANSLVQTPCLGQTVHATPGARVEVFARVPAARAMAVCADALYVGTKGNAVYGVPLAGGPAVRAASGLVAPNGVTCLENRLDVLDNGAKFGLSQVDLRSRDQPGRSPEQHHQPPRCA